MKRKNRMYKNILFDMDGTLINSYEGIYRAYQYTFEKLDLKFPGKQFVQKAIGAPLPYAFEHLCGMDPKLAAYAIFHYRTYYADTGKHQAFVYDGIQKTLDTLQKKGCFLGVVTLKREDFAIDILKEMDLFSYFDLICGIDTGSRLSKADLIQKCLCKAGLDREKTLLVGDSIFDSAGAEKTGIDFMAVTYGFGFTNSESLLDKKIKMIVTSAHDIASKILKA